MTFQLRPYQVEAKDAILKEWYEKNIDSTLLICATGLGKTAIFLSVVEEMFNKYADDINFHNSSLPIRVLIIAHRQELIYQPIDRIKEYFPVLNNLNPGVVMGNYDEPERKIIVATIQTLNAKGRLERVLSYGSFTHIIIDECHRSASQSFTDILNILKQHNPNVKILGVTATPRRSDGDGLSKVFQSIVYKATIADGIRWKSLAPFTAMAVELPVSIDSVPLTNGEDNDYNAEEMGKVLRCDNAEDIIISTWLRHASERQTIAFTSSVFQAYALADAFKNRGLKAIALDGTTDKKERIKALEKYKKGELQILLNCQIFVEGFDAPETSCILMIAPTKSDLKYLQSAGRGLRIAPGKSDCLILDFCPTGNHDMRMAGDLLGKPRAQKKQEEKAKQKGIILDCFGIKSDGSGIDGDPDHVIMTVLDFFQSSSLVWTTDGQLATVAIGEGKSLAIVLPDKEKLNSIEQLKSRIDKAKALKMDGKWNTAWDKEYNKITSEYERMLIDKAVIEKYRIYAIVDKKLEYLGIEKDWSDASIVASSYADHNGEPMLNQRSKRWRTAPATDKQQEVCKKIGCWTEGINKGEAAQRITHRFAIFALRKAGVL